MTNRVSRTDVDDQEFVDAVELASDGYTNFYRTVDLVSTTNATSYVVISSPTEIDVLENIDEPLQVGDFVEVYGNVAVGRYTVAEIVSSDTFRVSESIADSTGGQADFYHPAGATKVGFDPTNTRFTDATNVQQAIEDIDAAIDGYEAALPDATHVGQVLFSVDGVTFERALPVTSNQGWLVNDCGIHIVVNNDSTCDED